MDNVSSQNGYQSLLICIILSVFSWLTPERVDIFLKVVTALAAVIAAIFAARYHIMARRLKKKQLEKFLKDDEILE